MAVPTNVRLSGVFLLLCIADLYDTEQVRGSHHDVIIQNVDGNALDALAQQHEHVLAFFHDGTCETDVCNKAKEELQLVVTDNSLPDLRVVGIHSPTKEKELGIPTLPNLIFFHNGSPNIYPGDEIDVKAVIEWIEGPADELITPLDDTNFEHLTQAASGATTGDWFVVFYKSTCSGVVLPIMRAVANRLKGRVVVAYVDMTYSPQLVKRFKLKDCPTLKFFRAGNMYDFKLPKYDLHTLVNFAEGWYRNSRMSRVPAELTPFDTLTEYIALSLKDALDENHLVPLLIGGGVVSLVITLLCACCCSSSTHTKKE